ncbi:MULTISPECIES: diguanylate cyclase domain-containing protein [Psychrilyobacter]|uniref:Diguanylate cyclase n=1 Tax=Psychrilyobacter piezotolerans TaxID=2293438 RepID=A0ABX9KGI5_9FUSO|nr:MULTISPECIES: diguanylate cyclase [Psychrilyobacter]MCS5420354.1 diguanylate cyclase [Psychrilyobacter sp. S5]NDI78064.1 diguanylate cyclase [Psychrilyobacter piezotolerans]RDE61655.1 diguanylate cyclase [Psychrilyobacter sp. S5]REI41047.1 diguanylate cyclase [Psychrilyobacter piezotolerans]
MKNKTCILICSNFYLELKAVLDKEKLNDFFAKSFDCNCAVPQQESCSVIERILEKNKNKYSRTHLICSSGCTGTGSLNKNKPDFGISETKLCFNYLINENIVNTYLDKGNYIISPGWLNRWEHYVIDIWKFDQNTAREFFREHVSQLLLLDTGVYKESIRKIQQFSNYVDRPFEILPVGLDYFSLFIKNIILELKNESVQARQEEQRKISILQNKKNSDYSMICDWFGNLKQTMGEESVIKHILDLIKMLFAPGKIIYLSVGDGEKINKLICFPQGCDQSELMEIYENRMDGKYRWTRSGSGFCIKISHEGTLLGILLVDDIMFAEYRNSYLNTFLDISNIFGLTISTARIYSKFLDTKNSLSIQKSYFQQLFKNSPDGILRLDKDLSVKDVNIAFLQMFQSFKKNVIGIKIRDLLGLSNKTENYDIYIYQLKKGQTVKIETKIRSQNRERDVYILAYPIINLDELTGFYVIFSDISDRKNKEKKIRKLAYEDSLTGMLNRRAFEIQLMTALDRYRLKKEIFTLFIIDINKFKKINDTFGHSVGDEVLVKVAAKLKGCMRKSDAAFRIGGDEFALIIPDLCQVDVVENMAKRILSNLEMKFPVKESTFKLSASMGISICPYDGTDMETLYKKADIAMYKVKKMQSHEFSFFSSRYDNESNADLCAAAVRSEY